MFQNVKNEEKKKKTEETERNPSLLSAIAGVTVSGRGRAKKCPGQVLGLRGKSQNRPVG